MPVSEWKEAEPEVSEAKERPDTDTEEELKIVPGPKSESNVADPEVPQPHQQTGQEPTGRSMTTPNPAPTVKEDAIHGIHIQDLVQPYGVSIDAGSTSVGEAESPNSKDETNVVDSLTNPSPTGSAEADCGGDQDGFVQKSAYTGGAKITSAFSPVLGLTVFLIFQLII